jgi:hypothetical protein
MPTHHDPRGQRAASSWLRFLAAVIVLLVVAVGIPVGLVVACRAGLGTSQPLPGVGTWDEIHSWLTTQRSSTELARVALRVLISLCWLLWAGLLLSVLSSVLASRPALGRVRLPRLAIFDGFGAWIVAGLTALTSLAPNVAHAQPTGLPIPAAIAATSSTPTPAAMALAAAGITTYAKLADSDAADLKQAIAAAGMRGSASLVTWPAKARELTGIAS